MSFKSKPPFDKQASSKMRNNKMMRLSGLTETLISPAMTKRSAWLQKIIANWPAIAGDIAHWAQPADIKPADDAGNDGTLHLSVHSGRGPEAQARSTIIIQSINQCAGFALIGRITIKQDLPFAKNRLQKPASPEKPSLVEKEPTGDRITDALARWQAVIDAKEAKKRT